MAFGGGSLGLRKKPVSLQSSRWARTSGEQHAGQPHHNPWENEGSNNLGNHFQPYQEKVGDWEKGMRNHA